MTARFGMSARKAARDGPLKTVSGMLDIPLRQHFAIQKCHQSIPGAGNKRGRSAVYSGSRPDQTDYKENYPMPPRRLSGLARRFRAVVPAALCVALLASVGTTVLASSGKSFGASANANWSEFGFAPKGGRYNPHEHILNATNVSALKVLWSAQDSSFPLTAPAGVDGVVYSGTNAFDASTGKLLWATNSGGISPAVTKSTVYIDTQNGLCAYAAASGTNLWCAENNYLPDAPSGAAVVDGIAYFGSAL